MNELQGRQRDLLTQSNANERRITQLTNEEQQRQERIKKIDRVPARVASHA